MVMRHNVAGDLLHDRDPWLHTRAVLWSHLDDRSHGEHLRHFLQAAQHGTSSTNYVQVMLRLPEVPQQLSPGDYHFCTVMMAFSSSNKQWCPSSLILKFKGGHSPP